MKIPTGPETGNYAYCGVKMLNVGFSSESYYITTNTKKNPLCCFRSVMLQFKAAACISCCDDADALMSQLRK